MEVVIVIVEVFFLWFVLCSDLWLLMAMNREDGGGFELVKFWVVNDYLNMVVWRLDMEDGGDDLWCVCEWRRRSFAAAILYFFLFFE
jgi:hypothetical protein